MARGVANAELRVWTPQGAQILFVRQVSPTVEDLTAPAYGRQRRSPAATRPGAWADESRDYHVAVRLAAKAVGQEQLAARVQLALGDEVEAQGLVKAKWSDDSELTTRIDQQVAHYTGQTELAQAIQEGLAAKAAGNEETATTKLGRAVQLAEETGNEEATSRLRKVVDIEDEDDRHRAAQEGRREGRRDGPRHRLDQDDPGARSDDLSQRARVRGHRLLRHCGVADGRRRETPSPAARRHDPGAGARPRRPAERGRAGRRPGVPELRHRQRAGRAVLRGVRLRLHDRHRCRAPGRRPQPTARADPAAPTRNIAPPLDDTWVAEVWIDPQWYAEQPSPDPLPVARPARRRTRCGNTSLLVGRESSSRDIHPDIDCGTDNGVSRRHAQLTTDGTRWWVEDLGSSNGTFVADAVDPLPKTPIAVGQKQEIGPDDRIYVGAWTRMVIRKAAPGEVG